MTEPSIVLLKIATNYLEFSFLDSIFKKNYEKNRGTKMFPVAAFVKIQCQNIIIWLNNIWYIHVRKY
jgi:hypothetical protein